MRQFLEFFFHIESDFDYGFICGFSVIIILFLFTALFIILVNYFADLNDMRKEYLKHKQKELKESEVK